MVSKGPKYPKVTLRSKVSKEMITKEILYLIKLAKKIFFFPIHNLYYLYGYKEADY